MVSCFHAWYKKMPVFDDEIELYMYYLHINVNILITKILFMKYYVGYFYHGELYTSLLHV